MVEKPDAVGKSYALATVKEAAKSVWSTKMVVMASNRGQRKSGCEMERKTTKKLGEWCVYANSAMSGGSRLFCDQVATSDRHWINFGNESRIYLIPLEIKKKGEGGSKSVCS